MGFEQELSKKMFVITGDVKNWNLKEFSKWVLQNKNKRPPEGWIEHMNLFFHEHHLCVRLVFVEELEFCVLYAK